MGKGDTPRPVNKTRYDANYDRIFGEKPLLNRKEDSDDPKLNDDPLLSGGDSNGDSPHSPHHLPLPTEGELN